jgi:hypothetical protein
LWKALALSIGALEAAAAGGSVLRALAQGLVPVLERVHMAQGHRGVLARVRDRPVTSRNDWGQDWEMDACGHSQLRCALRHADGPEQGLYCRSGFHVRYAAELLPRLCVQLQLVVACGVA